jgi:hypothetical protein
MNATLTNWTRLGLILGMWLFLPGGGRAAGIPEPSVVFYGTIRNTAVENIRMTSGTLTWTFRDTASGWTATFVTGVTNVLDQFSYVLEVPCEQVIAPTLSSNALNLSGTVMTFDCAEVTREGARATFVNPAQTNLVISVRDRGRMVRLDLLIAAPCSDVDLNGLCDEWELLYLGFIGADPGVDYDGDGMCNWLEYRTGTDPLDPQSVFQFLSVERLDASRIRVEWESADGRYYSLLRYPGLSSTNYTVVQSRILATTPRTSWVDTNASPTGPGFYRLLLEP